MDLTGKDTLKIGYIMQNGAPDLSRVSGPQLHVTAVINGMEKLNNSVRTIAIQNQQIQWSDNHDEWNLPDYSFTKKKWFRFLESAIRRIQSELRLPFLGIFDSLHFADACFNQLKGFDILYERHGYMGFGGVLAARLLKIPLVLELNGNIIKEIDERGLNISQLQRKIGRWITLQTFRAADRVVAVSDALKRTIITDYLLPEKKISVVLNGVNLDLFTKKYDPDAIRNQYGLDNTPIVTFVGSFEPWHGVDLLVSSFAELQRDNTNAQLVLVGDGSGLEKAVQQASKLALNTKVKSLGRLSQEQVAAILCVTTVVVAPYPFDNSDIVGTPLKIMEYMAAGKGIVASTAPIHEIIEDGVTGLRVPPANSTALAQGMKKLLVDNTLCDRLGQNAAQQARKFSWDNVNQELIMIFQNVIKVWRKT